ncbi:hypothetical protein HU200_061314 [Digitaria exilis]|uniref:Uncharacterized protein n=1 Tax=Digitaria exilis TaxID=1010633 RepID=A0A835A4Y0_9POAL|nr:hypothetical protein HU200_061314 [Digitaria exilis]
MISIRWVAKQSGCLTQESRTRRVTLCMKVVQKRMFGSKKADGSPFIGEVWPGDCAFPDFTSKRARGWWASLVKDFVSNGVDGIWNDMNEPAVFNVKALRITICVYGMLMANASKRPFVLTRAGFIGSQRYAATWTGDNLSNWEHLHMSLPMMLQLCEEVCRLALLRRYRLLPHMYTLFYHSHTKGTPVAVPVFFADPQDQELRKIETSFLLGPLLVCASTSPNKGAHECSHKFPKGIWLPFDFGDSHPDLPVLYLQGGAILPVGLPVKHVGEATLEDDLSLIIALDENGKAEGVLFEYAGDGYEFTHGEYLLTYYSAKLDSMAVTVKVFKSEGSWKRPKRNLKINVLLGGGAMISALGVDGEDVHLAMPPESKVCNLVASSELARKKLFEIIRPIPDIDEPESQQEGAEFSKTLVDLKSGDWLLKVVPWIGGRIISMKHRPTGMLCFCCAIYTLQAWLSYVQYPKEMCYFINR